jgi:hypothetical protein
MELLQEAQNPFVVSRSVLYSADSVSGLPRDASEPSVRRHGSFRRRLDSVHLLGGRAIRSLAMPELSEVVPRDVSTPSRTLCSLRGDSLILLGQAGGSGRTDTHFSGMRVYRDLAFKSGHHRVALENGFQFRGFALRRCFRKP